MHKRSVILAMMLAASFARAQAARPYDGRETFESRWQGAWVVTSAPTMSDCNGIYSDNWVSGATVRGHGHHLVQAGTPARVDYVEVTPSRLTISLTLSERLYVTSPRREYTLANTARCQIDLKVTVPPGLASEGDVLALEALLEPVVERNASEEQAIVTSGFLPLDSGDDATTRQVAIAEHKEWKAAESNAAIESRLREWSTRNERISSQMSADPDYKAGFARGFDDGRGAPVMTCAELATAAPAPYWPTAANATLAAKGKGQKAWARGYQDGIRLAQGVDAVHALEACVPQSTPARPVKPVATSAAPAASGRRPTSGRPASAGLAP